MILSSKRAWKRIGYGFLILIALVMIAYGGVSLWANLRLAPRLAELRAAGEPTSIAELAPEPIPAEEDGATYLAEIAPEINAFGKKHYQFLEKTSLGKAYSEREDGDPPTDGEIAAIREILEKYPTIEPTLRRAVDSPSYASQLDYSLEFKPFLEAMFETPSNLRTCARFLSWKAEVLVAEGKIERAVQMGLLTMRLSRLQEQEPAIFNGLVAIAIRYYAIGIINHALRSGSIDVDSYKSLDAELAHYENLDWFARTLKTERAYNLSGADNLFPHFPVTWQGTLFKADTIDVYRELITLAGRPYYLSKEKLAALEQFPGSTPIGGTLLSLLYPALESAFISANHNVALVRCLRVLNALQAYQEAHGNEATGIADLDLSESASIDPFDGKPLKLKWTSEGWIIYSVYKDGVDDGGEFAKQQDIGLGPTGLLP